MTSRQAVAVFATAFGVLSAAALFVVTRVPFVHMESATYLANFLDGRGALEQIFDVRRNDFGLYQARELSYAFDLIDARMVAALFQLTGVFVPVSFVHLAATAFMISAGVFWLRRRAPHVDGWTSMLPSLLFLTSPAVLIGARHFRTAKSLAAVGLFLLAWTLWQAIAESATPSRRQVVIAFASALVLTLADRQGTFFALLLTLGIVAWPAPPYRASRAPLVLAVVLAIGLSVLYDLAVGPFLIRQFGHQEVNWALQSGTIDPALLAQPGVVAGATRWFAESISLLFGSFGAAAGALVVVVGALACARFGRLRGLLLYLGSVLSVLTFAALMKARHASLDAPDVRVSYYNLPLLALCVVAVSAAAAWAAGRPDWPRWRRPLLGGGLLLAGANLVALPTLANRVRSGADAPYVNVTVALQRCLRDGAPPADTVFAGIPRDVAWVARYRRLCERYRDLRHTP